MSERAATGTALAKAWRDESPLLSAALVPLSWAWAAGAAVDRGMYRIGLKKRHRAVVPVISIGNLVVGGAGKTPVTAELARRLLAAGRRVAIVTRGYGRRGSGVVLVSDGAQVATDVEETGDEPLWLAKQLPGVVIVVASRRIDGAREAVKQGAELVLLDDGFSHHALHRDADVVVIDDELGLGNRRLLPAGPLREPPRALRRATHAWLSRCSSETSVPPPEASLLPLVRSTYAPTSLVSLRLEPRAPASALVGKRVLAVCGIARPLSFDATLRGLGAEVAVLRAFPDHHAFRPDEVAALLRDAAGLGCDTIVTTEKDAMRLLPHTSSDRFCALRMALSVVGDTSALDALVAGFAAREAE